MEFTLIVQSRMIGKVKGSIVMVRRALNGILKFEIFESRFLHLVPSCITVLSLVSLICKKG